MRLKRSSSHHIFPHSSQSLYHHTPTVRCLSMAPPHSDDTDAMDQGAHQHPSSLIHTSSASTSAAASSSIEEMSGAGRFQRSSSNRRHTPAESIHTRIIHQSEVERLMPSNVCGAAIIGNRNSGKSSLAFQVCYTLAQRQPERQALFIHSHDDARIIAKTVRYVVQNSRPPSPHDKPGAGASSSASCMMDTSSSPSGAGGKQQQQQPSWDFSILENVFLKRFTTAQHLCWYFGSLHNQPDHLLPSVIVVDDLSRFKSSQGHDDVQTIAQILSVMRDAQRHIYRRTHQPCLLIITMESLDRSLLMPLTRQLGLILRIKPEGGGAGGGSHSSTQASGSKSVVYVMEEDRESAALIGREKTNASLHYFLDHRFLRILPTGSPYLDLLHG